MPSLKPGQSQQSRGSQADGMLTVHKDDVGFGLFVGRVPLSRQNASPSPGKPH